MARHLRGALNADQIAHINRRQKPRHDLDDNYVQYCLQKKSLMLGTNQTQNRLLVRSQECKLQNLVSYFWHYFMSYFVNCSA